MEEGSIDSIVYKTLGERMCTFCFNQTGKIYTILPDVESMMALGREVRYCENCDLLSIGEPIPPKLKEMFERFPDDRPEHERIL